MARAMLDTSAGLSARAPGRAKRTAQIHDAPAPVTTEHRAEDADQIAVVIAHSRNSRAWIGICDETGPFTDQGRRQWCGPRTFFSAHSASRGPTSRNTH
jgi:hypothetical protein